MEKGEQKPRAKDALDNLAAEYDSAESWQIDAEDESSVYAVSIYVNRALQPDHYVSSRERRLAAWCKAHPYPDRSIRKAGIAFTVRFGRRGTVRR